MPRENPIFMEASRMARPAKCQRHQAVPFISIYEVNGHKTFEDLVIQTNDQHLPSVNTEFGGFFLFGIGYIN